MSTSLLVGNLPVEVNEDQIFEHFAPYGQVKSVTLVRTERGTTRGFAVVVMSSRNEAVAASERLSSQEFCGRVLSVSLRKTAQTSKGFFGFFKSSD